MTESKRAKHTPGPWSYEHDNGERFYLTGPGGEDIIWGCGCCGSPLLGEQRQGAVVREANARLIALAPRLLEALESAMAFIDCHVSDPDLSHEMIETFARLQAINPHQLIEEVKGKA